MPGRPSFIPRITLLEYLALAICFLGISFTSYRLQHVTIDHQWDAASYEELAQESIDGTSLTADAPFVYRIGWPWAVARLFPNDIPGGFKRLNIAAAGVGGVLLLWWLQAAGIASPLLRLLLVALYLTVWQGPTRFVYFYAAIIDPPLLVFLTAGLLLVHAVATRYRAGTVALLALVCFAGTFFRESMILVPGCFLFVNNPIRFRRRSGGAGVPWPALATPFAASVAAMVLVRLLVVPSPGHYSFSAAVIEMLRQKPLFTVVLGAFLTFGPILAVVAYDYRATAEFLWRNQYLAAFLGADLLLAYIGGTDTERILLWSAPVMYLLLGRSFARHRAILSNRLLLGILVVAQAVSARVFLPVPDPAATGRELSATPELAAKAYGALNHLLGLDAFYFNLWSYFASGPWRLMQLALYLAGAALILMMMPRHAAREQS